jgi:hypothetical protein
VTIPGITFAIQDGALGAVPANAARICAKLGICSGAIASVAASRLIGSTTGGSGVTFTARNKGAPGNAISVTYAAPSGGTTTVTVSGTAIAVAPATGTTNAGIVTAIQANATANALVTVATTGTSSDAVIAVAQTYLTGGVTGNINTLISETNPTQVVTDLGYGPLPETVCHYLNVAGGQTYAVPLNPSTAGANTSVSHVGSGGGTVAVTGTPNDAYSMVVKLAVAGALGVAQFQWSQDGGLNYSATFLVPSSGTFVIPHTGLTLTFASTFVAGDLYIFSCTAPGFTVSDVQDAFAAVVASGKSFGFIHLVGPASSVAGSASMAAALETLLLSMQNTSFIYTHAILECASDTDANIVSAFASTVCTRVMVCAGFEQVQSSIPGSGTLTRSIGFSVGAREALVPEQNHLGRVADGNLPGVTALSRNEEVTATLDSSNFTTARTLRGETGFFITAGHMLTSPGSDFASSQNRRVMDLACTVAYAGVLKYLNDTIRVNKTGTIAELQAATIENDIGGRLATAIVGPGAAVAADVVVDRTNNVLTTKQINLTVRLTPNGYAEHISVDIGFTIQAPLT